MRFCLVLLVFLTLGGTVSVAPARATESVVLQLKWRHAFQFAGYYMAKELGYYAAAGLDVDMREATPDTDVIDEVVSGRAHFGVGMSSLLLARKAGKPVVVLGVIFQHSPQILVVRQEAPLQSVHGLDGKRLMLERHSEEILAYLKREGVPLEKLVRLPHTFDVWDLIEGRTDAISAYSTSEPYLLDNAGIPHVAYSPRLAGIDFYGDNLFTSERELRLGSGRIKAFRDASMRGWQYAMAHPEEAIAVILAKYAPQADRESLRFEASRMAPLVVADLVVPGYMNPGRWQHIADIYAEIGMLPPGFSLDGFLYAQADGHDTGRYYVYMGLALGVIVLIAGVLFYVVLINRREAQSKAQLALRTHELVLHNQILELISRGMQLPEVLHELALRVERLHPGSLCSILLMDENGLQLRHGAAPSLPDFYNQAIDGASIGDGVGSCGTAAFRGERVIVEDIEHHPYWVAFLDLARRAGLGSCWSQPFTNSEGRVLGTFAIYHHGPSTPSGAEIGVIEDYANLAKLAVERHLTQEALERSQAQYRLIAENSSDVIWLMDFATMKFIYISPSVERMRGWTPEEIMALPLSASMTRESAQRVESAMRENLARLKAGDSLARFAKTEIDQPCKDGRIIHTEVVTTLLFDDQGKPEQILGITRDITERKRVEAELDQYRQSLEEKVAERTSALSIAKEAAEAANLAKSTFLANMSHELRTPMNAIMGMTVLAMRRSHDEQQREQLAKVVRASDHLLAVINDILDISKIEAECLTLEHVPFRLGEVVDNVRSIVSGKAADKGIAFGVSVPPDISAMALLGDPMRLGQILINLVGNAVKFTSSGSVDLRVLSSGEEDGRVCLLFEVRDTGIGIADSDLGRLFNAFEQADSSTTRHYGGTGLGLAISQRLAALMGGRIEVRSTLGVGSTFSFTVCFALAPDVGVGGVAISAREAEAELISRFAGARLLLVEDEPINQEVAGELLRGVGLSVEVARDGVEAVELARNTQYDLVLMDMQMPNMNGVEATRQIRALPGWQEVPIVAMTANAFSEDRLRCIEAGMNDHVSKPVEPKALFVTLLKWLGNDLNC